MKTASKNNIWPIFQYEQLEKSLLPPNTTLGIFFRNVQCGRGVPVYPERDEGILNTENRMLTNTIAKEVQATLPLTFYRYIFDEIDSQYHKYFRAVLFAAPPQVYTYR